jgi:hypothetical protein
MNIMQTAKIHSIDPPSNATILLGLSILNIAYDITVLPSARNITIYQIIDDQHTRMRLAISGDMSGFCLVDESNQLITVNVLSSTFSVPNSEYHIYVGANFVKHNETNEPINKLPHSSWILRTGIY